MRQRAPKVIDKIRTARFANIIEDFEHFRRGFRI
jgi:hypothetical protein